MFMSKALLCQISLFDVAQIVNGNGLSVLGSGDRDVIVDGDLAGRQ